MQNIPYHIAYLLTRYEYVIVPGLGTFVVTPSDSEKLNHWGIFSSPENLLRFSPDIEPNDGLLAGSIAKKEKCSIEEANRMIDNYVAQVLQSLDEGKGVHIPWVGSLFSSNNKKLFQPERLLSCNALNYGLANFSMPYAMDLQQQSARSEQGADEGGRKFPFPKINPKILLYAASIAAVLVAASLILVGINKGYFHLKRKPTENPVSIVSPDTVAKKTVVHDSIAIQPPTKQAVTASADTTVKPATTEKTVTPEKTTIPEKTVTPEKTTVHEKVAAPEKTTTHEKTIAPAKTNTLHYYIIVASSPELPFAKKKLAEFQSKGFHNADIISSNGKHRIWVERFENKADADKFLLQFRKDHPALSDAWPLAAK